MYASVELSMYPLTQEYGTPILQLIERLRSYPDLQVHTNTMSTQLFGPYEQLMNALTIEMKTSFQKDKDVVMVIKLANLDLRP